MKERPILFNGEMVRAILDGRKTQTRRIMKDTGSTDARWNGSRWEIHKGYPIGHIEIPCPYGEVGDRLWVRETFTYVTDPFAISPCVAYRADEEIKCFVDPELIKNGTTVYNFNKPDMWKWRPSIHMPKWSSRITLEITDVRCEHLQDISEDDAIAEGCAGEECLDCDALILYHLNDIFHYNYSPQEEFIELWDSINKKRGYGWDKNPWVWVIKFHRIDT